MTIDHLDEEALSAALDDEATAEEKAHLAACPECRAGVARLAAVARAVATPVPRRPVADAAVAIERAVASQDEPAVAGGAVPRVAAGPGGGPGAVGAGSRRPRPGDAGRPGWVTAAAGLAAAVVIAGAVVGIVRAGGGTTSRTTSAASPPPAQAAGSATTAAPRPDTGPVNLGDQSDPSALAATVRSLLPPSTAQSALAAPPAVASTLPRAAAKAFSLPAPPCAAQGRLAAGLAPGGSEPNVLVASVRWRGQPAVVLVYSAATGPAGVVMRTADCVFLARLPI